MSRLVIALLPGVAFLIAVAQAQQPLTPEQQCENYHQELRLADIAHQEARARTGDIARQATEFGNDARRLRDENAKLKEEVAKLREAVDATKISQ